MPTPTVIEHLDVLEDCRPRLGPCREVTTMYELLLERSEKALDYRVVPAIPLAAHAALDRRGLEPLPVVRARILTAAIGDMTESCGLEV